MEGKLPLDDLVDDDRLVSFRGASKENYEESQPPLREISKRTHKPPRSTKGARGKHSQSNANLKKVHPRPQLGELKAEFASESSHHSSSHYLSQRDAKKVGSVNSNQSHQKTPSQDEVSAPVLLLNPSGNQKLTFGLYS